MLGPGIADIQGVVNPHTDPPPGADSRRPRDRTGLWLALILVLSFGVFAPTLANGFTFDDPHYARIQTPTGDTNPMVASLHPFTEYWHKPMNWGLPSNCRGFRPVTVYSYAAVNHLAAARTDATPETRKGDDSAWAHHLLNLLLHTLATLLVFLLVRSLAAPGPALIGALVFGVHALHSGPVASIVGRAEMLTFTLGATAMLLYTAGLARGGSARLWRLALAMATLMLGFGAKESGLAWAAFLPLLASARGISWRAQIVPGVIVIGVPVVAFLALRSEMLTHYIAPRGTFWVEHDANPLYYMTAVQRAINATPILAYAASVVLWPSHLSSNYGDGPFTLFESIFHWRFLLSSLGLIALLVAGLRARTRQPMLFLAMAAFFGFTFITSNIPFPIETIFGDRLLYAAVLALSLAAAWLTANIRRAFLWPAVTVLSVFVLHNARLSVERSMAWHDNMSLTTNDLPNQPDSVGLHIDMGNLHLWNFDKPAGIREFERALQIRPESPRAMRFLAENSDPADAEPLLRRALLSPLLVEATEGRRVHWALAQLLEATGRTDEAWREYETALACNPFVPDIRLHMLRECARRGDWTRFEALLVAGEDIDPDSPYFAMNRGVLLHHRGEFGAAVAVLRESLPGLPDQTHVVEAWLRLADCFLRLEQPDPAREIALRFAAAGRSHPGVQRERDRILRATAPASTPR
jgi:tetratricopeptide (TPR) repeat protein